MRAFRRTEPDVRDARGHPQALLARQRAQARRARTAIPRTAQPSLEAQIANLADEIAYNNHDVDDGLRSGLIELEELARFRSLPSNLRSSGAVSGAHRPRMQTHEIVRGMIGGLVNDLISTSQARVEQARRHRASTTFAAAVRRWSASAIACCRPTGSEAVSARAAVSTSQGGRA